MNKNDDKNYNKNGDYKAISLSNYQSNIGNNSFSNKNENKLFMTILIIALTVVVALFVYNIYANISNSPSNEILIDAQKSLLYSNSGPNGLINDLSKDGYTDEEISQFIDELNMDWDKQAVDYAYEKISYTPSIAYVTDEMSNQGFTNSEIDYALSENEFDLNILALNYSEKYVNDYFVSKQGLFEELKNYEFTDEQISYIENNMDFDFYRSAEKRATQLNLFNTEINQEKSEDEVKTDIINELLEEGFTQDQADKAVSNLLF